MKASYYAWLLALLVFTVGSWAAFAYVFSLVWRHFA